jgi:hypothetical protein
MFGDVGSSAQELNTRNRATTIKGFIFVSIGSF